jgi:malate permease and related proteins
LWLILLQITEVFVTAFSLFLHNPGFLLLIVCLIVGGLVSRIAKPPATLAACLNWWVIHIAIPALILEAIPKIKFEWSLWYLPVTMWLMFGGAWLLFAALGRTFNWSRGRVGALILTCGLSNTAFVGLSLIEALRGKEGLGLALIADQVGCFLMLAIGGTLVIATYGSGEKPTVNSVLKRVITFPPFIAFLLGLLVKVLGGWPDVAPQVLSRISATLVPIAVISVGLQIRFRTAPGELSAAFTGLGYKLALAPLGAYLLATACGIDGITRVIGVLQAAMAPMVSAAIMAEQHDLDPPLANLILVAGIVISFVSVPIISAMI